MDHTCTSTRSEFSWGHSNWHHKRERSQPVMMHVKENTRKQADAWKIQWKLIILKWLMHRAQSNQDYEGGLSHPQVAFSRVQKLDQVSFVKSFRLVKCIQKSFQGLCWGRVHWQFNCSDPRAQMKSLDLHVFLIGNTQSGQVFIHLFHKLYLKICVLFMQASQRSWTFLLANKDNLRPIYESVWKSVSTLISPLPVPFKKLNGVTKLGIIILK